MCAQQESAKSSVSDAVCAMEPRLMAYCSPSRRLASERALDVIYFSRCENFHGTSTLGINLTHRVDRAASASSTKWEASSLCFLFAA